MGADVELRPQDQQQGAPPVAWVVVEPADPESGEASTCAALLRSDDSGRVVLTVAPGQGLIATPPGRILLLVPDLEQDQELGDAPAVRVLDRGVDSAGGVEVEHIGLRARRPLRADDRFAVARTEVEVVGPFGPSSARMHDVSIEGLRLSTSHAPEVGDDVRVLGEFIDELGEVCPWQLHGQVMWADIVSPSLTLMGIHLAENQRATSARLVQWARRRGGTRTAVPSP